MPPTFATCSPTKPTRPTVAQAATTRSGPVSATRSWSLVSAPKNGGTGTAVVGTVPRGRANVRPAGANADPSERGFEHVDDPRAEPIGLYRRDVEPQDVGARLVVSQPAHREFSQSCLFTPRHRFRGRPEGIAPPGLHLAEHDRRVAPNDEVDLPLSHPPVPNE